MPAVYHVTCRLGLMTKLYALNPKAMSVIELYGILDPATRDWTDGILSNIFRDINKPTDKKERRSEERAFPSAGPSTEV